jgi:hypothetical protein
MLFHQKVVNHARENAARRGVRTAVERMRAMIRKPGADKWLTGINEARPVPAGTPEPFSLHPRATAGA